MAGADPSAGVAAKRMKWTREDNIDVYKCYLRATRPGLPTVGYGARMLTEWELVRPDRPVTVQRITDQLRFIKKTKKLADVELEELQKQMTLPQPNVREAAPEGVENERGTAVRREDIREVASEGARNVSVVAVRQEGVENSYEVRADEDMRVPARVTSVERSCSQADTPLDEQRLPRPNGANCTLQEVGDDPPVGQASPQPTRRTRDAQDHQDVQTDLELDPEQRDAYDAVSEAFLQWNSVAMEDRPALPVPRQVNKHKLDKITASTNTIIAHFVGTRYADSSPSMEDTNCIAYVAARYVLSQCGLLKTPREQTGGNNRSSVPGWLGKLTQEVEQLRKDVSRLTMMMNQPDPKHQRFAVRYGLDVTCQADIQEALTMKKLQLQATAERVRRHKKTLESKRANNLFRTNEKQFYRQLRQRRDQNPLNQADTELPSDEAIAQFWTSMLSEPASFDDTRQWYKAQREECRDNLTEQECQVITADMLRTALVNLPRWNAAGNDKVHGYWLKKLASLHPAMVQGFQKALSGQVPLKAWMVTGRTVLLPKTTPPSADPSKYRPITCLPVQYKVLSAITTKLMWKHINEQDILPSSQRGCTPGGMGCKEQLLVNKMVIENAKSQQRNLSMMYIDFRKAFDSVSHDWIREMLSMYKFDPDIVRFITQSMEMWNTTMTLTHGTQQRSTGPIHIARGIFQGDTMSPLLFCLAINCITTEVSKHPAGYDLLIDGERLKIKQRLYMDDIKLYANGAAQLKSMANIVEITAKAIGMSVNADKCAAIHIKHGAQVKGGGDIELMSGLAIGNMEGDDVYKYLGMMESFGMQQSAIKASITEEYTKRLKAVLKSGLASGNTVQAIVEWHNGELSKLDAKLRRVMSVMGYHHPRADCDRVHLPRQEGGRGIISLQQMHERLTKRGFSITKLADAATERINVPRDAGKLAIKQAYNSLNLESIKAKNLHGQFWRMVEEARLDVELTFRWLRSSALAPATEGLILAIQDQAIATRFYRQLFSGAVGQDGVCRMCRQETETVYHIIGSCSACASTHYVHRHNRVVRYVHWLLCRRYGVPDTPRCYQAHRLTAVSIGEGGEEILWECTIPTAAKIACNRPDIVLKNEQKAEAALIDISRVVPVIVGALGGLVAGCNDTLHEISPEGKVQVVQKEALLGTANIVRSILNVRL